ADGAVAPVSLSRRAVALGIRARLDRCALLLDAVGAYHGGVRVRRRDQRRRGEVAPGAARRAEPGRVHQRDPGRICEDVPRPALAERRRDRRAPGRRDRVRARALARSAPGFALRSRPPRSRGPRDRVSGIFVIAELDGAIAERIHALQERFDPKLAAGLPPHVTLIGSSGAGPIAPDTPVTVLRGAIEPLAAAASPITVRFGRPMRLLQREIVVL